MRVVLDTNVLVSGIFWPGKPHRILNAWTNGRIKIVVSVDTLNEFLRVLGQFKMPKRDIEGWKRLILENATVVDPSFKLKVIGHEPDNRFLECALAGNAKYIISGDAHLLGLKKHRNVKIVSPDEFVKILK